MYDVVVIGAGPAGSLSSWLLAKAGLQVLIVEKAAFPRVKLCGGGISRKTADLLTDVVQFDRIPSTKLLGSFLSFRDENLTYLEQDDIGYSVNRADFDGAILDAARNAGCDVCMPAEVVDVAEHGRGVTIRTEGGEELNAKYLVFAGGVNERLHLKMGYSGTREVTMALEVDVVPSYTPEGFKSNALFDFGAVREGYAWIFPKNGFFNVGAYWYRSSRVDREQRESLEQFVGQFAWAERWKATRVRGYPIPYRIGYRRFNTLRTLLVGDAAGAVENFFGEGLYYGLESGRIAAECIIDAIRNDRPLNLYSSRLKADVLAQVGYSRLTARLFYTHQRFGYTRMVRNKLMNHVYAGLIHGSVSQRRAFFATSALLPLSVFAGSLNDTAFENVGLLSARSGGESKAA
jgi:geranylgeranyl reductase family protein